MPQFVTLQAGYRLVTPMFMGGANPNDYAELRPPSIKGMLRFWYRAIDPEYMQHEKQLFGSTDTGQAKFSLHLRLSNGKNKSYKIWDSLDRYKTNLNGVHYISYPFKLGQNNRRAIYPPTSFYLQISFKKNALEFYERKSIIAALWLLGHIGGTGARSRRGFGNLALQSLTITNDSKWIEIDELASADGSTTADEWIGRFEKGLEVIKKWFPGNNKIDHTVFAQGTKFYLFKKGYSAYNNFQPWEVALNEAGLAMQRFRVQREIGNTESDYERVKAHLCSCDLEAAQASPSTTPTSLKRSPDRAIFGLPLTFRFRSLKYTIHINDKEKEFIPVVTFQGEKHDRSASPVFIRIVEINGSCFPFFVVLSAPLLSSMEKVKIKEKNGKLLSPPNKNLLDEFCDNVLKKESIKEICW